MIKIVNENGIGIRFPQNVDEISVVNLQKITSNISLAKHYAVVIIAAKTNLFNLCATIGPKNSKDAVLNAVPILAKINEDYDVPFEIGEKILIDRTSLERGQHVTIKSMITSNVSRTFISNNSVIYKNALAHNYDKFVEDYDKDKTSTDIIIIEAKIVPVSDIKGSVKNEKVVDPFEYTTLK